MLCLAAMIWSAYMFVQDHVNMRQGPPPPVTIERLHGSYGYDEIYSAIYIPANWKDTCKDQRAVVYEMVLHFNNFRNGNNKMNEHTMNEVADKWVCVK